MKKNIYTIQRVNNHLKNKNGVITELYLNDDDLYDISLTATTKNNAVSTYTIKHNNTYNNDKICIEIGTKINNQIVPSGLSVVMSDYVIFTFNDDRSFYLIRRDKVLKWANSVKFCGIDKYTSWQNTKTGECMLTLFDRPGLLAKCQKI